MAGVFFSAAEPSADENVALVVRALRGLPGGAGVKVRGIGGAAMRGAGVELLEDTVSGAAMGIAGLLRAFEVSRLLARVGAEWDRDKPGLVVCSDSWTMNVHVARMAKKRGIGVLWYVAPQAWASREGRVKQLREVADTVACILPFEEAFFRERGVNAVYVGHPLWDRIETATATSGFYDGKRPPVVGVLPGSRKGVVRANWPRLKEVMEVLRREFPGVRFRVPVTANAAGLLGRLPEDVEAREGAFDELIGGVRRRGSEGGDGGVWQGCDLCLVVSGTAALHVSAHRVPMIVVYYGNSVLWHLIGRWVVRTRTFSLVNLLSGKAGEMMEGRHVVSEFVPWNGPVDGVADLAVGMLRDPGKLAASRERLGEVVATMGSSGGKGGASLRVAEMVMRGLREAR